MDSCPKNLEKFVNLDKCLELIRELETKLEPIDDSEQETLRTRCDSEVLNEKFRKLIDPYQEQPELLEPYLSQLIQELTDGLKDANISQIRFHAIFKYLYQLIKVTGFKSIDKKFPHETDKLPLIIELLSKEELSNKADWQTRFVLTVWLSIVVLTPFDLAKFGSDNESSITDKIYSILMNNLSSHDSSQHVTSYCLAKFFSRPDVLSNEKKLVDSFIDKAMNDLANIKTGSGIGSMEDVQLIGYLRALAYVFKFLSREELKQQDRCKRILNVLIELDLDAINRELINHLIVKLIQRAGLALLPKRPLSWRYKRGTRILGCVQSTEIDCKHQQQTSQADASKQLIGENNQEEVDASEYLESILSILFVACQNNQTKIRWSAAKGIARISSRLSKERASDVIDTILTNFFNQTSSEFAWHGGSLTLAEMSRNGLILEDKLGKFVEIISQAIIYDKIKGSFAVGAHVRDAACYICWAMAKTYEEHLLAPYVSQLSVNLLCTALFDREFQCRRAASATFQELVGRQGTNNEELINILSQVDYQNVGQLELTYLHLASRVSSYGRKYSEPFVEHLLDKKIGHWDIQIRRFASDSLSTLMLHLDHEFVKSKVLPKLIAMSEQNLDNNAKHGAILGLAKVVKGLVPMQFEFNHELIDFMGKLVSLCEKQLKSKQQAANFIEAIGQIISSCEVASFEYKVEGKDGDNDDISKVIKEWETIAFNALDSDNDKLREIGSEALLTLYRTYFKYNKTCQDKVLTKLNKTLSSMNESSRCGALRALSKLSLIPRAYLEVGNKIRTDSDTANIILISITSYISKETHEKETDLIFAQAKAEACSSLVNFISNLDKESLLALSSLIKVSFDVLLVKCEDYTLDKRGDIGVVVRRASIKAIQELTTYLISINLLSLIDSNLITSILGKILQQCASYNNSARELASLAFYKLISNTYLSEKNLIPHREFIFSLLEKYHVDDTFNWRDDGTPIFVNLVSKTEFSQDLWIGLSTSVGQVSDMCAQQFKDALKDYLHSLIIRIEKSNEHKDEQALEEYNFVLESFLRCLSKANEDQLMARLLTSGLKVVDFLTIQGLLVKTSDDFQERLVEFCWSLQNSGKKDPNRLISVARALSSMLQFNNKKVCSISFKYCLQLLTNGYARVRVSTAEQLYLSILTYQDEIEENLSTNGHQASKTSPSESASASASTNEQDSSNKSFEEGDSQVDEGTEMMMVDKANKDKKGKVKLDLESAMELLSQTEWNEPLEKVKQVRDQISACLLLS